VRSKHNINIIGIKNNGAITPFVSPNHVFLKDEHLVISGAKKDGLALLESKNL
jgi:hypothetical protein